MPWFATYSSHVRRKAVSNPPRQFYTKHAGSDLDRGKEIGRAWRGGFSQIQAGWAIRQKNEARNIEEMSVAGSKAGGGRVIRERSTGEPRIKRIIRITALGFVSFVVLAGS
jgi:hypothetical protein